MKYVCNKTYHGCDFDALFLDFAWLSQTFGLRDEGSWKYEASVSEEFDLVVTWIFNTQEDMFYFQLMRY